MADFLLFAAHVLKVVGLLGALVSLADGSIQAMWLFAICGAIGWSWACASKMLQAAHAPR